MKLLCADLVLGAPLLIANSPQQTGVTAANLRCEYMQNFAYPYPSSRQGS